MGFWFLLILIVLVLLAVPRWPYNRQWGYWPGGVILALLVLWVGLIWMGTVAFYWPWVEPVTVTAPPATPR